MFTKRIWLLIGALTILSAGVISVGTYLLKESTPVLDIPEGEKLEESIFMEPEEPTLTEPEEISPVSEVDTSDWQVYRNEEYGFEIKYPKDWYHIRDTLMESGPFSSFNSFSYVKPPHPDTYHGMMPADPGLLIEITVSETEKGYRISHTYIKNHISNEETIIVDDHQAIKIYSGDSEFIGFVGVYIEKKGNFYGIEGNISKPKKEAESDIKMFNQILSTFKFIEQQRY